jgi:hypothetical protein
LGVVGVSGVPSCGVSLASAWILQMEWAWLDCMCLHHKFYDSGSFSRGILGASCGTRVFVYALVHVMCLCVYVSMVCQQCMLYDDMYSHDNLL